MNIINQSVPTKRRKTKCYHHYTVASMVTFRMWFFAIVKNRPSACQVDRWSRQSYAQPMCCVLQHQIFFRWDHPLCQLFSPAWQSKSCTMVVVVVEDNILQPTLCVKQHHLRYNLPVSLQMVSVCESFTSLRERHIPSMKFMQCSARWNSSLSSLTVFCWKWPHLFGGKATTVRMAVQNPSLLILSKGQSLVWHSYEQL